MVAELLLEVALANKCHLARRTNEGLERFEMVPPADAPLRCPILEAKGSNQFVDRAVDRCKLMTAVDVCLQFRAISAPSGVYQIAKILSLRH